MAPVRFRADGLALSGSAAPRLPSSIVYEILKYFSAPLLTDNLNQFPWYIAHICSSWRIEFLSMKRNFWNEITIFLHESDSIAKQERTLDVLGMFLECNRGCPFSFHLNDAGRELPCFSSILTLLMSESARWRRVTLRLNPDDIPTLYHIKGHFEHLESLDFSTDSYHDVVRNTVPETFTDLFMTAPRLTRMILHHLSTWNFNWSLITVLNLRCSHGEELARLPVILSQAVRVETLSMHFLSAHLRSDTSDVSITLPNLIALRTDSISLLRILTTPSLEKLHIFAAWEFGDAGGHPALVRTTKSFIARSQCRIQQLQLQAMDAASAIEILGHTPDVVALYLGVITSVIDIFGWLNEMHRIKAPKLTRLQSLTIYGSLVLLEGNQLDDIFDLVAWRQTRIEDAGSVVEKLQRFDFRRRSKQDEEDDEEEVDGAQERLRKQCEEFGIRYSTGGSKPGIQDAHDRSSDPYEYSSFYFWPGSEY